MAKNKSTVETPQEVVKASQEVVETPQEVEKSEEYNAMIESFTNLEESEKLDLIEQLVLGLSLEEGRKLSICMHGNVEFFNTMMYRA